MDRRDGVGRLPGLCRWGLGAVLLGLAALLGCTHQQTRLLSDDDSEHDRYYVETIGDKTKVGNAEPIAVGGVGLVVSLEGTGGDCPPDAYRALLEKDLQKDGYHNVKEILSSPDSALVMVTGKILPGSSKGDRIDLDVSLPRGSRATSLRGGYLRKCRLYNYDFARNLEPGYTGPQGLLLGHPIVEAEGMLLVGLGAGEEATRVRHGRIWGGGRCLAPAPFSLILNQDQQYARVAAQIENRINETFEAGLPGVPGTAVAEAKNNMGLILQVPPQYRLNTPHYLRVVRLIPLNATVDLPVAGKGEDRRSYRQKLIDDLVDPARTVSAALRLEALGPSSVPALKRGLQHPHPLVRFCSAEALAYLNDSACGEELARAVAGQPALRAFGLTALASLDQAISTVQLRELLTKATDDETRYGAFRALRARNENDPLIRGELLNDSFWLHRVAPDTPPLIHISSTRRAEIVLFGQEPTLKPWFKLRAGDFIVTATEYDQCCTISRIPLHGAPARRQCPLELDKVLHAMADLGATYPEAVALLQQAEIADCLSCRVRCDALPQAASVWDLVKMGKNKARDDTDVELIPGGQDLGVTPTLYDTGMTVRRPPAGE